MKKLSKKINYIPKKWNENNDARENFNRVEERSIDEQITKISMSQPLYKSLQNCLHVVETNI